MKIYFYRLELLSTVLFTNIMHLCTKVIITTLSKYLWYYYLLDEVKKQQCYTVAKSFDAVREQRSIFQLCHLLYL